MTIRITDKKSKKAFDFIKQQKNIFTLDVKKCYNGVLVDIDSDDEEDLVDILDAYDFIWDIEDYDEPKKKERSIK